MKRLLAAACLWLQLAAAPALAETPPAPPQSAAGLPAPTAATDAEMARKVALMRRYFVAVHLDQMMEAMMSNVSDLMLKQLTASGKSSLTAEQAKALKEATVQASREFLPQMAEANALAGASVYTEDELTQMVAFYESPVGQKVTAKTPELMQRSMADQAAILPKFTGRMLELFCAKTTCPKDQVQPHVSN